MSLRNLTPKIHWFTGNIAVVALLSMMAMTVLHASGTFLAPKWMQELVPVTAILAVAFSWITSPELDPHDDI